MRGWKTRLTALAGALAPEPWESVVVRAGDAELIEDHLPHPAEET